MNKLFLSLALLLLFSGCVKMKTEQDCLGITSDSILQQTSWGENLINTDESVVMKANITCWHNVALGYAAMSDPMNATQACDQILHISTDPLDKNTLEYEHIFCIDAIAKRLRNQFICQSIDPVEYEFEQARCINNATPADPVCVLTPFALLSLAVSLFFLKRKEN
ncbi:MAG: hypothetical protein GY852_05280 [bacterium]|nr:hypothetical protein [bacterium]